MPIVLNILYAVALLLLSPFLLWRATRTGRYRANLAAKWLGRVGSRPPGTRPVVWFHGVSVGEIHLLHTLVTAFRRRRPDCDVVVSSTTDTGLAEARAKFADCRVVVWPFDFSWAVANALDAVRPSLVVLAEAETWPNVLRACGRRGVPVAVVNGRMSERSTRRFARLGRLGRFLVWHRLDAVAAQGPDHAARFAALGVRHVVDTGSVKYDGATADRDTPKARELRRLLGPKPPDELLLVAGSTHAPEEEFVLAAFRELKPRFPGLRLVLVPRHPERADAVAAVAGGLTLARRSTLTSPTAADVLLVDTVGELAAAWALADVGYVGGTLDGRRGGQSMIEPAGVGVPTVFGPHDRNFRDAARRLVEAGGAVRVNTAADLVPALESLLSDAPRRASMGAAARDLVRTQQGATARTLAVLDTLLPPPAETAAA